MVVILSEPTALLNHHSKSKGLGMGAKWMGVRDSPIAAKTEQDYGTLMPISLKNPDPNIREGSSR
jgi:hypothetical protein